VSPVKYELGFCITEDGFFHVRRSENLKFYSSSFIPYGKRNLPNYLCDYICLPACFMKFCKFGPKFINPLCHGN
jgi:hypothetical protein